MGYGNAGIRPQVVWSNAILANIGVGVAVDILTNWSGFNKDVFFLHYDGNKLTLKENFNMKKLSKVARECNCFKA